MNEGLNKGKEPNLEKKTGKSLVGIYQDSADLENASCSTIIPNWDGKKLPDKNPPGFLMYLYEDDQGDLFKLDGTPIKLQDAYRIALNL